MVTIHVKYTGGLHTEAVHEPSGARISTDAPKDNQGKGECFSPTDLLAAALATCTLTVMGIAAERRGWDLGGATARVEKKMIADPHRRVGELDLAIALPAGLPEEARQVLEAAAKGCPVHHSLDARTKVNLEFRYGERGRAGA
ncbi:MAG: OsmC family protein [Planctomycetes bacterium]|nr:OsmC family protein [Planctomycetota bacterium]